MQTPNAQKLRLPRARIHSQKAFPKLEESFAKSLRRALEFTYGYK
jgi:hypothetical protein